MDKEANDNDSSQGMNKEITSDYESSPDKETIENMLCQNTNLEPNIDTESSSDKDAEGNASFLNENLKSSYDIETTKDASSTNSSTENESSSDKGVINEDIPSLNPTPKFINNPESNSDLKLQSNEVDDTSRPEGSESTRKGQDVDVGSFFALGGASISTDAICLSGDFLKISKVEKESDDTASTGNAVTLETGANTRNGDIFKGFTFRPTTVSANNVKKPEFEGLTFGSTNTESVALSGDSLKMSKVEEESDHTASTGNAVTLETGANTKNADIFKGFTFRPTNVSANNVKKPEFAGLTFGSTNTESVGGTTFPFKPSILYDSSTKKHNTAYSITVMEMYEAKSFEELRLEDYTANRKHKLIGKSLFGNPSTLPLGKSLFGNPSTLPLGRSLFGNPSTLPPRESLLKNPSSTLPSGDNLIENPPSSKCVFGDVPSSGSVFGYPPSTSSHIHNVFGDPTPWTPPSTSPSACNVVNNNPPSIYNLNENPSSDTDGSETPDDDQGETADTGLATEPNPEPLTPAPDDDQGETADTGLATEPNPEPLTPVPDGGLNTDQGESGDLGLTTEPNPETEEPEEPEKGIRTRILHIISPLLHSLNSLNLNMQSPPSALLITVPLILILLFFTQVFSLYFYISYSPSLSLLSSVLLIFAFFSSFFVSYFSMITIMLLLFLYLSNHITTVRDSGPSNQSEVQQRGQ